MSDFHSKYIKYKTKYLQLKQNLIDQTGGFSVGSMVQEKMTKKVGTISKIYYDDYLEYYDVTWKDGSGTSFVKSSDLKYYSDHIDNKSSIYYKVK